MIASKNLAICVFDVHSSWSWRLLRCENCLSHEARLPGRAEVCNSILDSGLQGRADWCSFWAWKKIKNQHLNPKPSGGRTVSEELTFDLFWPSAACLRPTTLGRAVYFPQLTDNKPNSSRNIHTDIPRIMVDQICRNPVAQFSCHMKFTTTVSKMKMFSNCVEIMCTHTTAPLLEQSTAWT